MSFVVCSLCVVSSWPHFKNPSACARTHTHTRTQFAYIPFIVTANVLPMKA